MQPDDTIRDEAALWAVRTGDPAFADWDGFTAWLEQAPAHGAAYDAAVLAAEEAAALLAPASNSSNLAAALPAANDQDFALRPAPARRRWAMPALAAAVAGLVALGTWQALGTGTSHVTAPGETRLVALGDGSTIALAGGSRLVVEDQRSARLEAGRALFTIRHDAADPFVLEAGGDRLVDAGTVFDVALGRGRLDVEVAEGAVIVNPDTVAIRLDPGERATRRPGGWQVGAVEPDAVGEWREGRITFREASLADIADQLGRASGLAFAAAPGSGDERLSGSVTLDAARRDPASLGPLLGVTIRREGDRWVLASP